MIDIALGEGERGVIIGATGTGKSTLATELLYRWRSNNPARPGLFGWFKRPGGLIVVIDSKPRFRATHGMHGLPVSYRSWATGDTIKDSVAIYSPDDARNACMISDTLVYQSMYPNGDAVPNYERGAAEIAEWLFKKSGSQRHTLFYVDEYYDILGSTGHADKRILRTIRAGRERYMTVLTGSQRPRAIPLATLTEATNAYVFQLEFREDIKYLLTHGIPIEQIPDGFDFIFFRRERGGERITQRSYLNVPTKAA